MRPFPFLFLVFGLLGGLLLFPSCGKDDPSGGLCAAYYEHLRSCNLLKLGLFVPQSHTWNQQEVRAQALACQARVRACAVYRDENAVKTVFERFQNLYTCFARTPCDQLKKYFNICGNEYQQYTHSLNALSDELLACRTLHQ